MWSFIGKTSDFGNFSSSYCPQFGEKRLHNDLSTLIVAGQSSRKKNKIELVILPDPDLLVAEKAGGTIGQEGEELVHLDA